MRSSRLQKYVRNPSESTNVRSVISGDKKWVDDIFTCRVDDTFTCHITLRVSCMD